MKCIHCNTDSTYPERQAKNGRCKQCLHAFAFDPRAHPEQKISDGLFQRAIKDVSEDGKLWFTEAQLCYELCRRLDKKLTAGAKVLTGVGVGFLGFFSVVASIATVSPLPFLLVGAPGAAAILAHQRKKSKTSNRVPQLAPGDFHAHYVERWIEVHGRPERLVQTPERPKRQTVYPKPQSELTSYSFDRVLVTETAAVAAMLVANNFHFENNCAILSLDGYPFDVRETIMEMLGRNPNLKVFAIHNASVAACEMVRTMRTPDWFPGAGVQVIDLGLRPSHISANRFFVRDARPATVPEACRPQLSREEAAWLEHGWVADLEQFRPARLMRSIYQGFARANQALATSGSDGVYDPGGPGMIWIHDPTADVHAADSFG